MTQTTGIGALERLGKQFERLEGAGVEGRLSRRVAVLLGAAVLAAIVAASLTPPGRAVAGKIGELVGIGDEPTNVDVESVVIGVGEGPGGRYEVFASTQFPNPHSDREVTCIGLNVPDSFLGIQSASCLTEEQKPFLEREVLNPIAKPAPKELGLEGETVVQGLARGDVAAVDLELRATDGEVTRIPAEFFSLNEELGDKIGSEEDVGFFIALVPDDDLYGKGELPAGIEEAAVSAFSRLRILATGEDGETLVDERYTDLTLPTWWSGVALGPRAASKNGAIPAEPPAMIRKAPRPAD